MKTFLLACAFTAILPMPLAAAPEPTDEWCADAVDYAMMAAMNRQLGYEHELISGSIDRNGYYLGLVVPHLKAEDMHGITDTVYDKQYSRFEAARYMIASCQEMQTQQKAAPKASR